VLTRGRYPEIGDDTIFATMTRAMTMVARIPATNPAFPAFRTSQEKRNEVDSGHRCLRKVMARAAPARPATAGSGLTGASVVGVAAGASAALI